MVFILAKASVAFVATAVAIVIILVLAEFPKKVLKINSIKLLQATKIIPGLKN